MKRNYAQSIYDVVRFWQAPHRDKLVRRYFLHARCIRKWFDWATHYHFFVRDRTQTHFPDVFDIPGQSKARQCASAHACRKQTADE